MAGGQHCSGAPELFDSEGDAWRCGGCPVLAGCARYSLKPLRFGVPVSETLRAGVWVPELGTPGHAAAMDRLRVIARGA